MTGPGLGESHLEIVRTAFERWNAGDREPPYEHIDPDCELVTRLAELRGQPYRGHDGVRQWIEDIGEYFDSWRLDIADWREVGDRVVAIGRAHFTPKGGDAELAQPLAWLFDMRDGKLVRWQTFTDPDEALAVAYRPSSTARGRSPE